MHGSTPLDVADVPGVVIAGVTVDAGEELSPVLVRVGGRAVTRPLARDPAMPLAPIALAQPAAGALVKGYVEYHLDRRLRAYPLVAR